jgi:hypothetical protein
VVRVVVVTLDIEYGVLVLVITHSGDSYHLSLPQGMYICQHHDVKLAVHLHDSSIRGYEQAGIGYITEHVGPDERIKKSRTWILQIRLILRVNVW